MFTLNDLVILSTTKLIVKSRKIAMFALFVGAMMICGLSTAIITGGATLGQSYEGDAKRTMKRFVKGQHWKRVGRKKHRAQNRTSRPQWMAGVKGCFVCNNDHRAKQHHPMEEFIRAVNKLKALQPAAFLSEEDMEFVAQLFNESDTDAEHDQGHIETNTKPSEDYDGVELLACEDMREVEQKLENSLFLHGLATY